MKLGLIDIVLYPKFCNYLKNDLPDVANVGSIRRAFMRYGQLDHAGIKRALKWNEHPLVDVTSLSGAYGEFQPGTGSNIIKINRSLVNRFETGSDFVRTKGGSKVHLAGVTILHEMIHWADDQDGKDYKGEEGELFEKAVYGKVLG